MLDGYRKILIMKGMNTLIKEMEADVKEKLYTASDLARMFGVSRQTIHNWADPEYPEYKFPNAFTVGEGGGKMLLVPASDVEPVRKERAKELEEQLEALGFRSVSA